LRYYRWRENYEFPIQTWFICREVTFTNLNL
jgi:hypothetical protein